MVLALLAACADPADPDPCALGLPATSIDAALDVAEQLPEPTLPCFLAALERPLGIVLTSDVFNTQPAAGPRSPRIVVRTASLNLTVVPVGEAARLLELGERYDDEMTVKAELEFPLDRPLADDAAFTRILASPGASETGCLVCHTEEIALPDGRFANTTLRPPDEMVVPLSMLREERAECDSAPPDPENPDRCPMYAALLDHGLVFEAPFAQTVSTQFGPRP